MGVQRPLLKLSHNATDMDFGGCPPFQTCSRSLFFLRITTDYAGFRLGNSSNDGIDPSFLLQGANVQSDDWQPLNGLAILTLQYSPLCRVACAHVPNSPNCKCKIPHTIETGSRKQTIAGQANRVLLNEQYRTVHSYAHGGWTIETGVLQRAILNLPQSLNQCGKRPALEIGLNSKLSTCARAVLRR